MSLACIWYINTFLDLALFLSFHIQSKINSLLLFPCELSPEYIYILLLFSPFTTLFQATILNYCSPHSIIIYSIVPLQSTIHMAATLTFLKCNHNNVMFCINHPDNFIQDKDRHGFKKMI